VTAMKCACYDISCLHGMLYQWLTLYLCSHIVMYIINIPTFMS
jgi:hypothetical protein